MNTPILMPNSPATRQEQYVKAWHHLLSPTATNNERAHAKCWLTYRTFDGEVSIADWVKQIEPVKNGGHLRWESSQETAECYLFAKSGDMPLFRKKAKRVALLGEKLAELPPMSTNYLRVMALLVYDEMLHGKEEEAVLIAKEALARWQSVWATFDPLLCPWRFCEMRADCIALHAIMRMLDALGQVQRKFIQAKWVDDMMATEKHTPWWKAMLAIQIHEKAIWTDPVTLVAQYQQIHTNNPKYGSGPSAEEVEQIRTVVGADGFQPAAVIDYGCGNSKLAETLFPKAEIRLYDPAIEALSKPPAAGCYDLGLCTDVMEHIPEQDIAAMWVTMKSLAPVWYFTIHTGQASQLLPDGRNAHVTQKPAEWWQQILGGKIVWQKGVRFGLLAP